MILKRHHECETIKYLENT